MRFMWDSPYPAPFYRSQQLALSRTLHAGPNRMRRLSALTGEIRANGPTRGCGIAGFGVFFIREAPACTPPTFEVQVAVAGWLAGRVGGWLCGWLAGWLACKAWQCWLAGWLAQMCGVQRHHHRSRGASKRAAGVCVRTRTEGGHADWDLRVTEPALLLVAGADRDLLQQGV